MGKIIIDAENEIFGRICSFSAKQALEGNDIIILNCEKSVFSGNKNVTVQKYRELRAKGGHSQKGPNHSKLPEFIMKKGVRGMLPDFRWGEGRVAFKRIMCYVGIPKEFEKEKSIKLKTNLPNKYVTLNDVSKAL